MSVTKLEAIEIYQKIVAICDGQAFEDVNTALNFARNKFENAYYKEQSEKDRDLRSQILQGGPVSGQVGTLNGGY